MKEQEQKLRKYVNNNQTSTENDEEYKKSLEYLQEDADVQSMKNAVSLAKDKEKERLRKFFTLVDKTRLTLNVSDYKVFVKYVKRNLTSEDRSKVMDIIKSVNELFNEQDNSLSEQIESILKEIDKTKNFELINQVNDLSNAFLDEQLKAKYRGLYLIYKADSIKDKNASAAYDLLNSATDYINNLTKQEDISMLRIKQAGVRRTITKPKKNTPADIPKDDKTQEKIDEINELLDDAEKHLNEKDLEDACNLIKTLPEGEDKNKLTARAKEVHEKIKAYNNKDVKEATELVKEAEIMGKYPVVKGTNAKIQEAIKKTNRLPDGEIKDGLSERINNLIMKMINSFRDEVERIEEKFKNRKEVSEKEITDLRDTFNELPKELTKLGFSKAGKDGYGIQMKNLIEVYNTQMQESLKKSKKEEDSKDSKKSLKEKIFGKINRFKEKFLEFGPHWLVKLKGKFVDRLEDKLDDAKEADDQKLIQKYQDKYDKHIPFQEERDTVNSVKLFASQQTLNKLKNVDLDKKQSKKFNKAIKNIGNIELRGLTKFTKDERAASNKDRVYTVIKQYLELLSIVHDKQKYKEHWYKKGQEIEMKEKVKADAEAFITDAYEYGTISEAEYKAYMEAINFIYKYRTYSKNNDIYQINYDEDDELVNINDAVEYYENPVSYSDKDSDGKEVTIDLPHIIRK